MSIGAELFVADEGKTPTSKKSHNIIYEIDINKECLDKIQHCNKSIYMLFKNNRYKKKRYDRK